MSPIAAAPASATLCNLPFSLCFAAPFRRCFLAASALIAAATTVPLPCCTGSSLCSSSYHSRISQGSNGILLKSYNLIRAYSHMTVTRTTLVLKYKSLRFCDSCRCTVLCRHFIFTHSYSILGTSTPNRGFFVPPADPQLCLIEFNPLCVFYLFHSPPTTKEERQSRKGKAV